MAKRVFQVGLLLVLQFTLACCWWTPEAFALSEEQQLISQAWRIVNYSYVDESFNHQNWWFVRQKALKKPLKNREETYEQIQEMLASLDEPFTRLLKPDQYRSLQVNTSGELTGVGLQIALDEETGTVAVIAPIDGSPGQKAGLKPGDRILEIEGTSTVGLTLDEAAVRMRGPVGSTVTLTVKREGTQEVQEIPLVRELIALNPVNSKLQQMADGRSVGYIRLSQFNANAATEVAQTVQEFENQGANAYILDLRSNPGGLLQSGIEIARLWLDGGTIVYTVNRQGIVGSFEAIDDALTDDPLVVLVDRGTASASEILAGALQDNGRALLVGEKTFGKGLIQSLFDLADGSGLAVTVAKYETPNHRDIHKLGIVPDKEVTLDPISRDLVATEFDRQYQAALDLLIDPKVVAGVH